MTDVIDESVSLQERALAEAVARVTGRRPRVIEIPPPNFCPPPDPAPAKDESEHG